MTDALKPLVSTSWLADRLGDPSLRVLDATIKIAPPETAGGQWSVVPGRAEHDAEHIPGTQYADLLTKFSAPVGRFPRPSIDQLTASLQEFGIDNDSRVVIYDRAGTVWAARLWWVLRSYGIYASVLDGGYPAWQAAGLPTTSEPTAVPAGGAPLLDDRIELFVDRDDVLSVVESGSACLVNALDASDFTARETTGYARAGRIPGSLNVPASGLLAGDGTFLPAPILRDRFADVLARPGRKIMYCGGGVAACADALALTLLGEEYVAVYDASYEEWAADPALPVEVEA